MLNLHFHALVLDGVYASPEPLTRPVFHPAEPLTDRDVERVTAVLHRRILRHLARSGRLRREAGEVESEPDEPLLAELYSASLQGRGVLAQRGQPGLEPLGRRREARPLSLPGELCASLGGLSLHAKVALEADDYDGRERLARYLLRPPIASERLSLDEHGRVVYRLRRHWKDGTRAVVFLARRSRELAVEARTPGERPERCRGPGEVGLRQPRGERGLLLDQRGPELEQAAQVVGRRPARSGGRLASGRGSRVRRMSTHMTVCSHREPAADHVRNPHIQSPSSSSSARLLPLRGSDDWSGFRAVARAGFQVTINRTSWPVAPASWP